jgi:hypothetical protein
MEPGTGLTILGTAIGSAKLVEKVLGPTAEYLGEGIKSFAEKRFENLRKIFENASRLIGDVQEDGKRVHPRVLKDILDDGSLRDDEISASYYGGVLASSRSGVSRDDRGAAFSSLLGRLTTYQLRAHFILYRAVREVYFPSDANLQESKGRRKCGIFIPFVDYLNAMGIEKGEQPQQLIPHVFFGLARESLIEDQWAFGPPEGLKQLYNDADTAGVVFYPSALGVELFLWATANSAHTINDLVTNPDFDVPDIGVPLCSNARRLEKQDKSEQAVPPNGP